MGRYLNPGNVGFQTIRNSLYVDKSEMISFINSTIGTVDKLTCVSRPRRFGKSFAVKMLCAYYDKSCDSRVLFQDLKIAKNIDFEKYLNRYQVIYLDITLFISTATDIQKVVTDMNDKVVKEIQLSYPEIKKEDSLADMLFNVSSKTGDKFIIIIDEWDALFREAKEDKSLQKKYLQFLRSLFKRKSSLTDTMIEAAYMTGILPIKKYGTQSALTDFREYTMIAPKKLAEYVGFTELEVENLCKEYDMDFKEMKKWYDGYSFSKIESVYSPNSVIEAIRNEEYNTYWTETETYESLKIYIDMDEDGLRSSIVQLLGGLNCNIDIGTFQNDMTSIKSKDDIFTLLIHLGYLAYDSSTRTVRIPNEEVRREFIRALKTSRHTESIKLILESDKLLQNTLSFNEEAVAQAIQKIHSMATAPIFYNNEQALRSVIRMAYISCVDEFQEIQELPSGNGYADIVYLPKKNSMMPIMIVELKWNKTAKGAIQQIKERNYPQIFDGFGSEILLVGINYDETTKKHSCKIEKQMGL
jgi:hypothetical protein